jgi:hypothetical protein
MESLANELIKDYRQTKWKEFLKRQVRNPQSSVTFWKRVNHLRACIRKRRIEAHILNNIKVTKNTEKAELFAESLESKFKQDMNSQFENDFYMKINEFINKESIKNKFPLNQRVVKEFTYQEPMNAIKNMNSKTSVDPIGKFKKKRPCGERENVIFI